MIKDNVAFLFVGQGSQEIGMGKDFYESIPRCKEIFLESSEILNMDMESLMFNGTDEELKKTENAQPAILLASLLALEGLKEAGIYGKYTAGLSLGEYGALIYGGAISFEDGLKLVKERGKIMGSSLPKGLGKMAAILKLNEEKTKELLNRCSEFGIIQGANYNCPGQVVVSGENKPVEESIKIAKELGGMGILLNVSGPFHSSLLEDASFDFMKELEKVDFKDEDKVIYSNVKGLPYEKGDDKRELLKNHIKSAVLFEKTIKDMLDKGVDTFIEIGPGKTLKGFVKKIDRKAKVFNVYDVDSLNECINAFKE